MKELGILITDIRITNWDINRLAFAEIKGGELRTNINTSLGVNSQMRMVNVINKIGYYNTNNPDTNVVSCVIETEFKIDIDDSLVHEDFIDIPEQGLIPMVSVSISHSRALFLSQSRSSGLPINLIFPLVDPTQITKQLIGNLDQKNIK